MRNIQTAHRTTVLVVEDDDLIRLGAVDLLEDAGFVVHAAECADGAIQALERRRDIGLVFTDINMPGAMDGLELARRVGARWPVVRLVVTSGREQIAEADLPAGGVFIAKPYTPSQLVAKLRAMLAQPRKFTETSRIMSLARGDSAP